MIVVTGATGNVGRPLVRALAAAGERVTAVSRGITAADFPEGVGEGAGEGAGEGVGERVGGVRPFRADLADPESLRPAFEGADALFFHDTGAGAHLLDPQAVLGAAKAGGVRRVVLLSSIGVASRAESDSHGGTGLALDHAVRQSGMEWTVLRAGGFASNAYAWAESVRTRRTVAAPFAGVGLPVVDPADIAEVAAVALREDGHAGQVHELTGPELTTPRRQAEALGEALGEPVRFVELSREEARVHMLAFMPEPVVETTLTILGAPNAAELRISPAVEQILGRPPRTFEQWAGRHIAAFR